MSREQVRAFLLHARDYRNSSLLVDLLTFEKGLVHGVVRGGKKRAGELQLFSELVVVVSGRRELKTVVVDGAVQPRIIRDRRRLYSGMYLNELLVRLLRPEEPLEALFSAYRDAVAALADSSRDLEPVLRTFELELLGELGYGIDLSSDASGMPLEPGGVYAFDPEQGFVRSTRSGYSGALLLENLTATPSREAQRALKEVLRSAITPLLGGKELVSRRLFAAT